MIREASFKFCIQSFSFPVNCVIPYSLSSKAPMHTLRPLCFVFAFLCLAFSQLMGSEEALLVPVEEGIHRIQVEIWDADKGEWVVYSIAHLDGTAGMVKVRIPANTPDGQWRVQATQTALIPKEWIDDDSTVKVAQIIEGDSTLNRDGTPGVFTAADSTTETSGETEVVESDIWKVDGTDLYFFNQLRGLQVFDVSDAEDPFLKGSLRYPARGDQMYQLSSDYTILLARDYEGTKVELVRLNDGAPYIAQSFSNLNGYTVESRLIGHRLYVVTRHGWEETIDDQPVWKNAFLIYGIDFSDPSAPVQLAELEIELNSGWGNVVAATSDTLIVSANEYVYDTVEGDWWAQGWHYQSTVYLIDLDTPDGSPELKAQGPLAGRVADKFKFRLEGDVLTAISQAQGYRLETYTVEVPVIPDVPEPPDFIPDFPDDLIGENGEFLLTTRTETRTRRVWYRNTVLENLVLSGNSLTTVGAIELADNETLRATRFDGDRAYIVTFEQIDPLFIIDLADPANPSILGELEIPGWSNYLQVLSDDRLFSVGVEDRRVALSLFDVGDPQNMSLLSRVYLGDEDAYSWSEANYDEKAVSIFAGIGLALIPYQSYDYSNGHYEPTTAMQLVEFDRDRLTLRGSLSHEDRARRATLLGADTIVSISNEELITASIEDLNAPSILADLTIAWSVDHLFTLGDYLVQVEKGAVDYVNVDPDLGLWEWTQTPQGRVTSAEAPDLLLAEFSLSEGILQGITMRSGMLYALYLDALRDSNNGETNTSQYRLEVFDFSDPLTPELVGSTTLDFDLPYSYYPQNNSLKAVWKDTSTLVWLPSNSQNGSSPWWPFYDIGWGGDSRFSGDYFWYPYGANSAHILVSDVSNAVSPAFLDGINLVREKENGSSNYSEAILHGDDVFLTENYHWWEQFDLEEEDKEYAWQQYRYVNHIENTLLSLSISAEGLVSESFRSDIPGALLGVIPVGEDAKMVITREWERLDRTENSDPYGRSFVHAHLFDGTQLLPIDTFAYAPDSAYSESSLSFAFADRVSYRAGHDSYDNLDTESTIDRVAFGFDGEFSMLPSLDIPKAYSQQLDTIDGHLLARSSEATKLWKVEGTDADLLGEFESTSINSWWGWSWGSPGNPLIQEGDALYIPAGQYGIDIFELPNEASASARAFPLEAVTLWESVPSESCLQTLLDAEDAVGVMDELRWRFRADDFATVDPNAGDVGDYWFESLWYGFYHQRGDEQWMYHLDHGWLWTTGVRGQGAWTYDSEVGWCWTSEVAYPFMYSADQASWLYFFKDENAPSVRWFYNMASDTWDSVSRS